MVFGRLGRPLVLARGRGHLVFWEQAQSIGLLARPVVVDGIDQQLEAGSYPDRGPAPRLRANGVDRLDAGPGGVDPHLRALDWIELELELIRRARCGPDRLVDPLLHLLLQI